MAAVPRYRRIRYRATALDGTAIEREAAGFHARVVQHECDHLDGVLYPARVSDFTRFGFVDEMRRFAPPLSEEAI
jgi:peptide deformylase